jgi:hypothetical protein
MGAPLRWGPNQRQRSQRLPHRRQAVARHLALLDLQPKAPEMQRIFHLLLLALALAGCQPNTKDNAPTTDVGDADGDGVPRGDDCDDTNIELGDMREDADCDGTWTLWVTVADTDGYARTDLSAADFSIDLGDSSVAHQ